ncbi:UNVERIFIED_CONTAM: spirocyclase, AveC family, partial [Bacillus amyloliquefaciens DSM 7 = ATCC 23350]
RPRLGTFIVMFVIINIAYLCYGGLFAIVKATKISTSVACPWPYPEVKIYDPQGFYEENGQPGPYSVGIMSTWMSGQPDGRPDVELGAKSDRCAPDAQNG